MSLIVLIDCAFMYVQYNTELLLLSDHGQRLEKKSLKQN